MFRGDTKYRMAVALALVASCSLGRKEIPPPTTGDERIARRCGPPLRASLPFLLPFLCHPIAAPVSVGWVSVTWCPPCIEVCHRFDGLPYVTTYETGLSYGLFRYGFPGYRG